MPFGDTARAVMAPEYPLPEYRGPFDGYSYPGREIVTISWVCVATKK